MRGQLRIICINQYGSVSMITALFLALLIGITGFVLDKGVYYSEGAKLQNSLDSAVLAASMELPASNVNSTAWAIAENEAISYAYLNKIELSRDDLEPIYESGNSANRIIGMSATKTVEVKYSFIRVLGIRSGTVTRTSSAGLSPAGGVKGVVPLCISAAGLHAAIAAKVTTGLIIKCSTDTGLIGVDTGTASGWFGAVRIEGAGASDYSNLLSNGYSGTLKVGQVLDMECGNMSGPTMDGFIARVSRCREGCTAESYLPDCPRLVYVPVIDVLPGKQVKIVSFAAFFLESCGGNGSNSYIKASYVKDTILPDSSAGESGQDFGLYVNKLLN
ncbi:MAG: Tad domain-containing protein [Oscillospiraceae bacterium]